MGERREAPPMHPDSSGPGGPGTGVRPRAGPAAEQAGADTSDPPQPELRRSQKASQPQQSRQLPGQSDGPPERAGHQNKKERLEGHAPRKNTATATYDKTARKYSQLFLSCH